MMLYSSFDWREVACFCAVSVFDYSYWVCCLYFSVPSYQYDDTKKTIIRLEQGARSCLQRAMTSQGALAILYGRHLRHYIRKPEVLYSYSCLLTFRVYCSSKEIDKETVGPYFCNLFPLTFSCPGATYSWKKVADCNLLQDPYRWPISISTISMKDYFYSK